MTAYTDRDGWKLVEDRTREPGAGLAIQGQHYVGHPIDVYRRRFPDWTAGLTDLQILELWHVEEVDRRLNAVGLPAQTVHENVVWVDTLPDLDRWEAGLKLRARFYIGTAIRDPRAPFVHVPEA